MEALAGGCRTRDARQLPEGLGRRDGDARLTGAQNLADHLADGRTGCLACLADLLVLGRVAVEIVAGDPPCAEGQGQGDVRLLVCP